MINAIGIFSLLFFGCCTAILPSRSTIINKIDMNKISGTYVLLNSNNSNSYVQLLDTIGFLYINSIDLKDQYEKYNIDYSLTDTLKPITTNCCKEFLWKPKEGSTILYNCKDWEKGIGYYKGNYSLIQLYNNDTLYCEAIDTVNGMVHEYLINKK
jgi:hypothetical protein